MTITRCNCITKGDVERYDAWRTTITYKDLQSGGVEAVVIHSPGLVATRCFSVDPRQGLWSEDFWEFTHYDPLDFVPDPAMRLYDRRHHKKMSKTGCTPVSSIADVAALHAVPIREFVDEPERVPRVFDEYELDEDGFWCIKHYSDYDKTLPGPRKKSSNTAPYNDWYVISQLRELGVRRSETSVTSVNDGVPCDQKSITDRYDHSGGLHRPSPAAFEVDPPELELGGEDMYAIAPQARIVMGFSDAQRGEDA